LHDPPDFQAVPPKKTQARSQETMESKAKVENREAMRQRITTSIEFIVEEDIIDATTVDVSKTGIRFNTKDPPCFTLRFKVNNQTEDYRAQMVWAATEEDGSMTYGLKFIEAPKPSDS
jgi:hypothetical protein